MEETRCYSFYQHRQCEYFPCHRGVPEGEFNCLFCYCPLYALGRRCGGSCRYTAQGIKSCMDCTFPHWRENYDRVMARYDEIMALVRKADEDQAHE